MVRFAKVTGPGCFHRSGSIAGVGLGGEGFRKNMFNEAENCGVSRAGRFMPRTPPYTVRPVRPLRAMASIHGFTAHHHAAFRGGQ